ncbi:membrane transporter [Hirsutella rhossiliensis]|uniref:Membrane transporter n=1 Tax=Hirsutella rhossiliensis TaxID=111463 RepID=A0A9P8SEX9_9HYPO|nr:membrane transporter [Hirsutella rhossiliensis]KAH0960288.1 membrane transporter [Hirsutella rhossiliensis]
MSTPPAPKTCSPAATASSSSSLGPPPPDVDVSGLDGLSLAERKCALVDREPDAQGMGRYRWYVWGLCSFGYFLALLWAQAFGLRLPRPRRLVGFGVGGNIPIDGAIFLEFIPQRRRFLLACLSVFQPASVIVCSALAFAFIPGNSCAPNFPCCPRADNMGWRYLLFTLGGLTLAVFFMRTLVFTCQETPKFLIYRCRDAKAIETMAHVAKTNNTRCRLTLDVFDFVQPQHDCHQVRSELSPLSSTLAASLLPASTSPHPGLQNGAASIGLEHTYASYIYYYGPGIVAVLLGAFDSRVPAIGQKWTMVASAACMGASIFLLSQVDTPAKSEGFFVLEYFFQSMFNASLYGRSEAGVNAVLYLAGSVRLGCVLTTALLPTRIVEDYSDRGSKAHKVVPAQP